MEFSKDLNAASASPLILTLLASAPSYGYAIIRQVEMFSNGVLKWEEGMLYPILHRMEKQGWISSYWDTTGGGRKRKYYQILEEGRHALDSLKNQWKMMDDILRGAFAGDLNFDKTSARPVIDVPDENEDDWELPVSLL